MVTAGANMAFMHAVLAITEPGDEIILQRAVLFQSRDGDSDGRLHGGPRRRPTRAISCGSTRCARAVTDRTRAIVTVSPNNPSGAVFPEAALREVNALCRERGIYHIADEVVRVLHLRSARGTCRPARFRTPPRTRSRCTRCRRRTALPAGASATWCIPSTSPTRWRRARTRSSSARRSCRRSAALAALDVGRAYCEPYVARARRDSRHRRVASCRRWRRSPPCRPPTARSTAC